jgi:hypothetical protein
MTGPIAWSCRFVITRTGSRDSAFTIAISPARSGQARQKRRRLLFVVRLARLASLSDSDRTQLGTLAADVAALVNQTESAAGELDRLRKAAAVDRVLPVLFKAVTIQEIADRVSTIGSDAGVCESIAIDHVADGARFAIDNPWPFPLDPAADRMYSAAGRRAAPSGDSE